MVTLRRGGLEVELYPTRMMDRAKVLNDTYIQPLLNSYRSELALTRLNWNRLRLCASLYDLPGQKLFDKINGGERLRYRESSSAEAGGVQAQGSRAYCVHVLAAWELLEVVLLLRRFRSRCVQHGCRASFFVLRLFLACTQTIAALLGFCWTRHMDQLTRLNAFNNLRDRFRIGFQLLLRVKIFLVLFYYEIAETLEGCSEMIEDILRAEAVSRGVVRGLDWVLNNEHLLLVGLRQNIVWPK